MSSRLTPRDEAARIIRVAIERAWAVAETPLQAQDEYRVAADALLAAGLLVGGEPTSALSEDERETVEHWIGGIERGLWNPTNAMKRAVADVLKRLLAATESARDC